MKTFWGQAMVALGVVALPTVAVAQAAAKPCITPAEAQALVAFLLPDALSSISDQCRPALPADAVLTRSGKLLAQRYRPDSDAAWPLAKQAFGRMSDAAIVKLLDDATLKKLVAAGIGAELAKKFKTNDCGTVDRFVTALEPLPPKNMALLLGALIEVGARASSQSGKDAPFNICPAPAAAPLSPNRDVRK